MLLLAIDPGPAESAYCFYDTEACLPTSFGKISNQRIRELLEQYSKEHFTRLVVIEEIASYGMPVGKEVFATCIWIGRFWELALKYYGEVALLPRLQTKLQICKSPKANDSTIIQALKDRFGEKGTKKNPGVLYGIKADEWQALALAVAYSEINKLRMDKVFPG